MIKKSNVVVLLLGFLVGAIGYWMADFSKDRALFESVYYINATGAFLATLIAGIFRKKQPSWNALMVTFGVVLGMLSRIVVDILFDPTSHNLFPFELMIGLVIVLPACFFGAYLTHTIFHISGKS